MCRRTSPVERTLSEGRQPYFSAGVASARATSFFSASSIWPRISVLTDGAAAGWSAARTGRASAPPRIRARARHRAFLIIFLLDRPLRFAVQEQGEMDGGDLSARISSVPRRRYAPLGPLVWKWTPPFCSLSPWGEGRGEGQWDQYVDDPCPAGGRGSLRAPRRARRLAAAQALHRAPADVPAVDRGR